MCTKAKLLFFFALGMLAFDHAAAIKAIDQAAISEQSTQKAANLVLQVLPKISQEKISKILQANAHLPADDLKTLLSYRLYEEFPDWFMDRRSVIYDFLVTPFQALIKFQLFPRQVLCELLHGLSLLREIDDCQRIKVAERRIFKAFSGLWENDIRSLLQELVYDVYQRKLPPPAKTSPEPIDVLGAETYIFLYFHDIELIKSNFDRALPLEVTYRIKSENWDLEQINASFASLLSLTQKAYTQTMIFEILNSVQNFLVRLDYVDVAQQALFSLLEEIKMLQNAAKLLCLKGERTKLLELKAKTESSPPPEHVYAAEFVDLNTTIHRLLKNLDTDIADIC